MTGSSYWFSARCWATAWQNVPMAGWRNFQAALLAISRALMGQMVSSGARPFSRSVLPVSTISTMTSERPRIGAVPKPLVMPLAQEVDIRANCYVGKITEEQITRLVRTLKGLTFPITDYAPFEYAVVTAGGVRCDEVNPYTMESLKVKGLYFAGEVLDIDANTGGYNLQIAFSTGRLAGSLKK